MIPKIIHYCWLSNDPIPERLKKCMASWKKFLPDYEVMKWDFNRLDKESFVWVKEAFENKKYAFAADFIRLYALYNYGGIYLDMDVEILKSFNNLLKYPYFMCYEHDGSVPEVAAFGVEAKQDWIKDWLQYYKGKHFISEDGSIPKASITPLPKIAIRQLKSKGYHFESINTPNQITSLNKTICLLPCDYFSPKSYENCKIYLTENTYSIHHFAGSWLPKGQVLEHKFWNLLGMKEHYIMKHFYNFINKLNNKKR